MNPPRIIIDSSVVVKWYLPDESDDKALQIKSDFTDKIILLVVPLLFFYEVSNILRTTAKSLRITRADSVKTYHDLLGLNFLTYSSKELFTATLDQALVLGLTTYDASYVVLSDQLQIPFYTADQKLVRAASTQLVRPLDDY